jgi:hypothetical protein
MDLITVLAVFVVGVFLSAGQADASAVATWARQAPASRPSARGAAGMAYDAATGTEVLFGGYGRTMAYDAAMHTIVLFGGEGRHRVALDDTWTWDGSAWTQQAPAASPPSLPGATMAYDAATGTVVLFGGANGVAYSDATWTWDGSTRARQHPATHPLGRTSAGMAYDAAAKSIVLFGGFHTFAPNPALLLHDTWTWMSMKTYA